MDTEYFEGQQNISKGNRRGDDKLLVEVLNESATAAAAVEADVAALQLAVEKEVLAEEVGTGAPQNVAHSLGKVPTGVLVSFTDVPAAGGAVITEGVHTDAEVVLTVTALAKFKVLVF